MVRWRTLTVAFALALGVMLTAAHAVAESLESLLPYVVENHDRTRAAKARVTAARNRAREALGDWFPTLGQTANVGTENQNKPTGSVNTSTGFGEYDLELTQMLWDFGATNAGVERARLDVDEAKLNLIAERQSLILDAITAYTNVRRAHAVLNFARKSEQNIRQQTGLEEALVGLGSGFSTDVLQAKTQLAGAQARRNQAEGSLTTALNGYRAIFGTVPSDLEGMEPVPFPAADLPRTLDQAIDIALTTNPKLKVAQVQIAKGRQDVRKARGEKFFPTLQAVGSRKFKNNVSGTLGHQEETLAKIEMTWDINLGLTAINTLRAAKGDLSASEFTAGDTRRTTEQQVRDAWDKLATAKRSAAFLQNQAHIAAAFLELARKERQLGRRSLIDVLSGETNLINAQSDAASARADVVIAAYGLLQATGQLNYDVLTRSHGVKPPIPDLPPPEAKPANLPADQPSGDTAPAMPATPATPVTPAPPPAAAPGGGAGMIAPKAPEHAETGPSPLPPDPTASATPLAADAGDPQTLRSLADYYLAARARDARMVAEGSAPTAAAPLPSPRRDTAEAATLAATGAKAFAAVPSADASIPGDASGPGAASMAPVPANFVTAAGGSQPAPVEQAALPPATTVRQSDATDTTRAKHGGLFSGLITTLKKAAAAREAERNAPPPTAEWGGTPKAPLPPTPATAHDDIPSDDPISAFFRVLRGDSASPQDAVAVGETKVEPDVRHMPPAEPALAPRPEPTTADDLASDNPFSALMRTLSTAADAYDKAHDVGETRHEPDVRHMPPAKPEFAPKPAPTSADNLPSDDPISALFSTLGELFGDHGRAAAPSTETPAKTPTSDAPAAAHQAPQAATGDDATTSHAGDSDPLTVLFRDRLHIAYAPRPFAEREIN